MLRTPAVLATAVGAREERACEAADAGGPRFGRGPVVGTRNEGNVDCGRGRVGAFREGGAIRVDGLGSGLIDGGGGGFISDGVSEEDDADSDMIGGDVPGVGSAM